MNRNSFWAAISRASVVATSVLIITLISAPGAAAAGKYKTLYRFTGGEDGAQPLAGLVFDELGALYGTASQGGNLANCNGYGCGVVFKLTPNPDGSWSESVLYEFCSLANCDDGANPFAGLTIDKSGNLYGTTYGGHRDGIVFKLTPNLDGSWTESVLYEFCSLANCDDGADPFGRPIFDAAGNLYGTAGWGGGDSNAGVVFELTPNPDGSWSESTLYTFTGGKDGWRPLAGLTIDGAGNLYGTTNQGGNLSYCGGEGCGVVFELTPRANGSWKQSVLHRFTDKDGSGPWAGVTVDGRGNLYGTAEKGGAHGFGVVFGLTLSDGKWTKRTLHQFGGWNDGAFPEGDLLLDPAGKLYGTASWLGRYGFGVVFELSLGADGRWREHVLHTFKNRPGASPAGALIFDQAGNLYGTSEGNSQTTFGSVFELTP